MKRIDCKPLQTSAAIYQVLSKLKVGEQVPERVYISDYENSSIPLWQVAEHEQIGVVSILTLIDPTTRHEREGHTCHIALDVFYGPAKTLAGRHYHYFPGCKHARHMLCDIRQAARRLVEVIEGDRRTHDDYARKVARLPPRRRRASTSKSAPIAAQLELLPVGE